MAWQPRARPLSHSTPRERAYHRPIAECAPMVGPYGTLRALVPAPLHPRGLAIGSLLPPLAQEGLKRHGLAVEAEANPNHDTLLLRASRDEDDAAALLSLRCRASQPIEQQLLHLHGRWGTSHHLDVLEMASRVLDDDGRPLTWTPAASETPRHEPFSLPVLRQWRPELASLDRWCRVRVQSDPQLRQLLLSHGLLLLGPWALLASASRTRMEQAWSTRGQAPLTTAAAADLHGAFLSLYRQAKERYKLQQGRSRGWTPDQAFLERLRPAAPAADTLELLLAMARALRRHRLEGPPSDLLIDPSSLAGASPSPGDGDDTLAELATLIEPALQRACHQHRAVLLSGAPKDVALLRCLWGAYSEGLNQRATAERCGCSQPMVSRRLRLQQHATAIATAAARDLGRRAAFGEHLTSVEACERLVAALRDHLFGPHPEEPRPRLAVWLALAAPPNTTP
jgi:hypothetical protein